MPDINRAGPEGWKVFISKVLYQLNLSIVSLSNEWRRAELKDIPFIESFCILIAGFNK